MALRVIILLGLLLPVAALAQEPPCGAPAAMNDGWAVASPDAVGFVPAMLCGIGPRLTAWTEADIHSVLVMRHGKLVYEHYFAGEDQQYGRSLGVVKFDAGTQHDLRSITKSVTALVLGI
jgi:CubicO group peptidase (beta-lactamase class C family)